MTRKPPAWTLESLVDFEQALAGNPRAPARVSEAVVSATRGLEGASARRVDLRVWLEEVQGEGRDQTGRKFMSALGIVGGGLALAAFLAGISGVLGMLDHERGGVNVIVFLGILIGGQWLVLTFALVAWVLRRRAAEGFSGLQSLVGKLALRLAGQETWWDSLMRGGGTPRWAVLWRLARLVQAAGVFFNLGIVCGLVGLVLVKHVGFYWETTTEGATRSGLVAIVKFLSVPWSQWWAEAVPDSAVIDMTRWLPARTAGLAPGPGAWWEFLLLATVFWGLLPRVILWLVAWKTGCKALEELDFQGRAHRALWREITGPERVEGEDKPLDGVLVLDVGGSGLSMEQLRPFLLRRLRVHPAAWHTVAVLDEGAEEQATFALAKAPAGVVFLVEGWALSPRRMEALHARVRMTAGTEVAIRFLVANVGSDGRPTAPSPDERREWVKFVDSLRDPATEVFLYEELQATL